MTDWLDDILDEHPGAPVPEGFADRVLARLPHEQAPAARHWRWLPQVAGLAAAAALFLAVGFWMGHGAHPLEPQIAEPGGETSASLDVDEIYANRELLEDMELLSDAELELVFQDDSQGTWILDVDLPQEGAQEEASQ